VKQCKHCNACIALQSKGAKRRGQKQGFAIVSKEDFKLLDKYYWS